MDIFSVIVLYYPVTEKLNRLCSLLVRNSSVILVDNTPNGAFLPTQDVFAYIANRENLGIAAAQNIGLKEALARGAKAVAFFDQDSQLSDQLLPRLIAELDVLGSGIVIPISKDSRSGIEYPSYRLNKIGWPIAVYSDELSTDSEIDLAISSGTLVSSDVFAKAEMMDEGLFIDYVDFEWCTRVRAAGFKIRVAKNAVMQHSIGLSMCKTLGLRTISHSPIRSYYKVRNAFLILRCRHVPILYSLNRIIAALFHHVLQWPHSENPALHLQLGLLAVRDGLLGRRGMCSASITAEGS